MKEQCNAYLVETIRMTHAMINLADRGEENCTDSGCAVVYGILRDSAYRVKREAERERDNHLRNNMQK